MACGAASGVDRRADQDQRSHLRGPACCEFANNLAAHRVGDERRTTEALGLDPRAQGSSELTDAHLSAELRALPLAGQIRHERREAKRGESSSERKHVSARHAKAVYEYDRDALADHGRVHPRPGDVAPDALHDEWVPFAGQLAANRHSPTMATSSSTRIVQFGRCRNQVPSRRL